MSEVIPQAVRLRAAAHIKAIEDSGDRFAAADAEALAGLLRDMPIEKIGMSLEARSSGPKTSGEAAGAGNASLDGEEKQWKWSVGEREFRCGAYVVTRAAISTFDIRHVGNVDATSEDGHLLRLKRDTDGWNAYLNRPWHLRFWPFLLTIGGRYILWKRSR